MRNYRQICSTRVARQAFRETRLAVNNSRCARSPRCAQVRWVLRAWVLRWPGRCTAGWPHQFRYRSITQTIYYSSTLLGVTLSHSATVHVRHMPVGPRKIQQKIPTAKTTDIDPQALCLCSMRKLVYTIEPASPLASASHPSTARGHARSHAIISFLMSPASRANPASQPAASKAALACVAPFYCHSGGTCGSSSQAWCS